METLVSAAIYLFRHKRRICNTCTRAAPTSLYQHGIFMQQLITTSTEATSENLPFVATTAGIFLGHNPGDIICLLVICCWQLFLWLFQRWRPSTVNSSAHDWWQRIGKMSPAKLAPTDSTVFFLIYFFLQLWYCQLHANVLHCNGKYLQSTPKNVQILFVRLWTISKYSVGFPCSWSLLACTMYIVQWTSK